MFDLFEWHSDHLRLGDLLFRLEHFRNDKWNLGDNHFRLYKVKGLFEQYQVFFGRKPNFQAKNILEIGMWDGGSLAILNEVFLPSKLVGIDSQSNRGDSDYFKQYLARHKLEKKVRTYWGTDQGDAEKLREILKSEFEQPLDLVMDDASHLYEPTKTSFEVIFPHLREGGIYIIEDWAWLHWPEFDRDPYFAGRTGLTQLVLEIVEMIGSARGTPPAVLTVLPGFVAIEKTSLNLATDKPFRIEDYICRRPVAKFAPPARLRELD
ncbi:MAG: class I SAM-dependent methyltransferase [Candidatus Obscuribacterales bacterium]|nr:class I SAM-dependent methyltransferase [Candidatus Obscuribacterales bacterium]